MSCYSSSSLPIHFIYVSLYNSILNIKSCHSPVAHQGCRYTSCTAAVSIVVYLRQNSLTEPIPLHTGFEYIVFLLLDRLQHQARDTSLTCYLIHNWEKMHSCLFQWHQCEVNKTESSEILTRLSDFTSHVDSHYAILESRDGVMTSNSLIAHKS